MNLMDIFGYSSEQKFKEDFSTQEKCLMWIADKKWENGFVCRSCGHTNFCKGSQPYSRRCTKCKKSESATANTLFHRCRLPLPQAFSILHQICENPEASTRQIADKTDARAMTCWSLKNKMHEKYDEGGIDAIFGRNLK